MRRTGRPSHMKIVATIVAANSAPMTHSAVYEKLHSRMIMISFTCLSNR
jgi:hypothetical protein